MTPTEKRKWLTLVLVFLAVLNTCFPVLVSSARGLSRLPLGACKALAVVGFALNVIVVSLPMRLDSPNNQGVDPMTGKMRRLWLSFFSPAPYAFVVWPVIYLFESLWVGAACLRLGSESDWDWLPQVAVWYFAAHVFQCLWCFSFTPLFKDRGLWLPASFLTATAAALIRTSLGARSAPSLWPLPVAIHGGWCTAAALVNWNAFAAMEAPVSVSFMVAGLSTGVACLAGLAGTLLLQSPAYGLTVAWALAAVALETRQEALPAVERAGFVPAQRVRQLMGCQALAAVAVGVVAARCETFLQVV